MTTERSFTVGYPDYLANAAFFAAVKTAPAVDLLSMPRTAPEAEIASMFRRVQVYYVGSSRSDLPPSWHVTRDFLARFPNIMLLVSRGAGYDTVDLAACTAVGVPLINQAGGNAPAVAEHALGMMLVLSKRIPEADAALRKGTVQDRNAFMGHELGAKTVGLIGLGHTGSRTAELTAALGCQVAACDPYLDEATISRRGARKVDLSHLLAESDVVSVHCPRTSGTLGMLGAAQFGRMRAGAIFVSTARGGIHDEAALYDALVSGHLAGAGLDVWEQEPPAKDHPLLSLPNVIASPHLAGVTYESRANVARMAGEAIVAACRGEPLPRVINPETAASFAKRWREWSGRQGV